MEVTTALSEIGKLTVGIIGVVVVSFLILMGPFGWLLLGIVIIGSGGVFLLIEGRESRDTGTEKTNCLACGARTPIADDVCEYCGEEV